MNAQWEDEILKESQYLGENLKTKASIEAKRSHDLKYDILCMFVGETYEDWNFFDIVTKKKEGRHSLNYVLKEDETADFHVHVHAQLSEINVF